MASKKQGDVFEVRCLLRDVSMEHSPLYVGIKDEEVFLIGTNGTEYVEKGLMKE